MSIVERQRQPVGVGSRLLAVFTTQRLLSVAIALLVVLAVTVATADRSPRPWLDEVLFADPGFNLAAGDGFQSRWWPYQPAGEPFASNAPLYSGLVAAWSTVAVPTLRSLRILNALLLGLAGLLLLGGLWRRELVKDWRSGVMLILLLYGGYAMTFAYRSARYDVVGILLVALMFFVIMGPIARYRLLALAALAALLPATGLQLMPYVALLCGIRLAIDPDVRQTLRDGLAIAVGMVAGGAAFLGILGANGVAPRLFDSVFGFSDHGVNRDLWEPLWTAITVDPSSSILLIGMLGMLIVPSVRKSVGPASVRAVLAFGLGVPVLMTLAGKYPVYYGWMSFAPLAVVGVVLFDQLLARAHARPVFVLAAIMLIASYGLPGRLYVAATNWEANDPAPLAAAVSEWVRPGDTVYATPLAYFAVREITPVVYGPPHFWFEQPWHGDIGVDVLIVAPAEADEAQRLFGGEWLRIGGFRPAGVAEPRVDAGIGQSFHALEAYRRVEAEP